MAIFDLSEQRICIRIVYDGAAGAGKTTNLEQLASLFAAQRSRELFSPASVDGRTLYFDWMQIRGGLLCGFPLLCQVVSVPGQLVLSERRRYLLSTADVVVYVCDSAASIGELARQGLSILDQALAGNHERPPVVLQANKQDQADALPLAALAERLGREWAGGVEAIARDGIGVVDTFVAAARAASQHFQARSERAMLALPVKNAEAPERLLSALDSLSVDPMWAAEMCLEEAASAFALDLDSSLASVRASDRASVEAPVGTARGRAPFPRGDVPAGSVWPAHTGRTRLRSFAEAAPPVEVSLDDTGRAALDVGDFRISTSLDDRFESFESAQQAIVRSARQLTQLGELLAPQTVLALQSSEEGAIWLWTISPRLPIVADWLTEAPSEADKEARTIRFAAAVGQALAYTTLHGIALDPSPSRFGLDGDRFRYLGKRWRGDDQSAARMIASAVGGLSLDDVGRRAFRGAIERERERHLRAAAADEGRGASAFDARAAPPVMLADDARPVG